MSSDDVFKMSSDDVDLCHDSTDGGEKRRRSVHFNSNPTTVLVPGGNEEGEWRGGGTGHFTPPEKVLVKTDGSCATFPITDESAEQARFQIERNRRLSDPTAPTHFQTKVLAAESHEQIQRKGHVSDGSTGEFIFLKSGAPLPGFSTGDDTHGNGCNAIITDIQIFSVTEL